MIVMRERIVRLNNRMVELGFPMRFLSKRNLAVAAAAFIVGVLVATTHVGVREGGSIWVWNDLVRGYIIFAGYGSMIER